MQRMFHARLTQYPSGTVSCTQAKRCTLMYVAKQLRMLCNRNCIKDQMITLYTFGPRFGLPDASPFVMKAELLLKMSGVDYRCIASGPRGAPKGKLPFIEDNGTKVADS